MDDRKRQKNDYRIGKQKWEKILLKIYEKTEKRKNAGERKKRHEEELIKRGEEMTK